MSQLSLRHVKEGQAGALCPLQRHSQLATGKATAEHTSMTAVSRREFHAAAITTGDSRVLEAYFAQAHVAQETARVNGFFEGRAPSINIFDDGPDDPWYFISPPADPWRMPGAREANREFLFAAVLSNGVSEVLAWFYASQRTALFGPTLAALLPFTGALAADENQVDVVEMLLTSEIFATFFDESAKQQLLSDVLSVAVERSHVDVIDVLVAHGADVNPPSEHGRANPLASSAAMGNEDSLAALIDHGAFVVGSSLLIHSSYLGNLESACELLRSGVDWGNHTSRTNPLHAAAEDGHADLVRIYLEEGFADVDVRNMSGETALMMATWQATADRGAVAPDAAEAITYVLIEHGADVTLRDTDGNTALHHAVGTEYSGVVALLLESGLDPNAHNSRGECALDSLPLDRLDDGEEFTHVVEQLELLVLFGTDLLARRPNGACAFDHLQRTKLGRSLLWRLTPTADHQPLDAFERVEMSDNYSSPY